MDGEELVAGRQRMQALLDHTSGTLQRTTALLERQRETVQWLEEKNYPTRLSREIYDEMLKIVGTLRWQKAWIELDLRRTTHLTLPPQPHPWAEQPPPDLLSRICVELNRIVKADGSVADPEATERAVDAAIARAVGR